ncbi:MAG TPA: amino acid adenylation domain-containing protein [Acidobacteriota bacterium]|nr:amino acid adenylation domain-containing protein [Acidobacteriota bacterium]
MALKRVTELFERKAEECPDAAAIFSSGQTVTYGQLNRRANQLARHLIAGGLQPAGLVGLHLERSVRMLEALLAILKAGGAYLPLDPDHPVRRLRWMLDDARVDFLLTRQDLKERLAGSRTLRVVDLDADWPAISRQPKANPPASACPEDLVYCIYTSGSTGRPKAVAVAGPSLLNHVLHMAEVLRIHPQDRVLQFTSISIDAALEEIFPAWSRGAAVVLPPARVPTADQLQDLLDGERVSVLSLPSAYWHHWVDALCRAGGQRPQALRLVFVGGDRLLTEKLVGWRELPWSGEVEWIADYGPTEATISCAIFSGPVKADEPCVPIGRPIANVDIHILGADLEPVRPGETGELFISGKALARGYLNRPALTAERFLPDPFAGRGARMYRSGDRGHLLADGNIQFAGRVDNQVKIRGHRVELDEVEAALRRCPGVREAAVVAYQEAPGDMRLAAYVVARNFSRSDLRRRLSRRLPAVMVPSVLIPLKRLPLSPVTAKLDRSRLPAPQSAMKASLGKASELELVVADLFQEYAGGSPESLEQGFFACGGDSLRALCLLGRIAEVAVIEISFAEFQRCQSVRSLAALLLERWNGDPQILVGKLGRNGQRRAAGLKTVRRGRHPASRGQQRLWFLDKLHGRAPVYSVPFGYRIRGDLSLDELDQALTRILARHESLRTALVEHEGKLCQEIAPPMSISSRRVSVSSFPSALAAAEAAAREPFDLSRAPLFRSLCIQVAEDEHLLFLNFHHCVFDAWSLGLFWRELCAFLNGQAHLPEPGFQYGDYADWQSRWLRGNQADRQREFWRRQLSGELPSLRLNRDVVLERSFRPKGALEDVRVEADLSLAITQLARRLETTEFTVMLAAFAATLFRHSRQDTIVVGVPAACRPLPETEAIIGYFTNTVALPFRFPPGVTFQELVVQTSRLLSEGMANQQLPFDVVVDELSLPRRRESNPVFQAMFVLQSTPADRELRIRDLDIQEVVIHTETAKVDLTCTLRRAAGGYEGELEYATPLLNKPAARSLVKALKTLLHDAVRRPQARLDELALLPARERQDLAATANARFQAYSGLKTLHQGFEEQVRRYPEAVAIEARQGFLTYRELNSRANRLARVLIEAGAGPEARIGICIERSFDLVAALLAVLKSGAAFVPLDPAQPVERLRSIAQDGGLQIVVTRDAASPDLAPLSIPVGGADDEDLDALQGADPGVTVSLDNLACLYYTSGSTGRPKGVAIDHRCAMNRLRWLADRYPLKEGERVLHKTPLIFDVAIWEIFGPLHAGAAILMTDPGSSSDVAHIQSLLNKPGTVFAHFVPSMLEAYLRSAPPADYPDLRWIQVSGEAMAAHVLQRFSRHFAVELHNLYGQTETSEVAGWEGRDFKNGEGLPIGTQLGIYRLFILDSALSAVPPGVTGELYVAGCGGLARGYYGQPRLTAEKFLPNPYAVSSGERLYRTGDLACFDDQGLIRFLGRGDQQTKIRGCRVECGEIESVLSRHPSVATCAVVLRPDSQGSAQLVAYVVGDRAALPHLAAHAERFLPTFMLPAVYVFRSELPLTPSGKLDRRALPPPQRRDLEARVGGLEPEGQLQSALADLWKEVLGLTKVGRNDNFFAVGGNSLKCIQVLSRVDAAFGVQLSVRDFFSNPTIEGLADATEQAMVAMVASLPEREVERRLSDMGR